MISVVFAYYNRRNLLINTIRSISRSKCSDFELVIVDDASDKPHAINDLKNLFPMLNINVIRIDKSDKWWINPCIPMNIGFHFARGEYIVLQNPECLHTSDILKYVEDNLFINKYLAFGCYAIDAGKTQAVNNLNFEAPNYFENIMKILNPMQNVPVAKAPGGNKWYQHSKFRPSALNFCTAITKADLDDLGGFDERYAEGVAVDDKEFILRIRRKGMVVESIDNPFVVHQWHQSFANYDDKARHFRNKKLYLELEKSKEYRVNNESVIEVVGNL